MSGSRQGETFVATIADSASLSDAFSPSDYERFALLPATGTEGDGIQYEGSLTKTGTFVPILDDAGAKIETKLVANQWSGPLPAELAILLSLPWLKLRTTAAGVAQAQTGATTITVVLAKTGP